MTPRVQHAIRVLAPPTHAYRIDDVGVGLGNGRASGLERCRERSVFDGQGPGETGPPLDLLEAGQACVDRGHPGCELLLDFGLAEPFLGVA